MTQLPQQLELLESDLRQAAHRRVRQLRRRRATRHALAVLVAILVLAGAGLAASGVDVFGWLGGGDPSTARFSIDAGTTYRGPAPPVLGCDRVDRPTLSCHAGPLDAERVYAYLTDVYLPYLFSRRSLLDGLAKAEQSGSTNAESASEARRLVQSVPDDFFEKLNVLARLNSVGTGFGDERGPLVPPEGVPLLITCLAAEAGSLECRPLAGAAGVPVGAPIYAARPGPDWIPAPPAQGDALTPANYGALIHSIWGRELTPGEVRLLALILTPAADGAGAETATPVETAP